MPRRLGARSNFVPPAYFQSTGRVMPQLPLRPSHNLCINLFDLAIHRVEQLLHVSFGIKSQCERLNRCLEVGDTGRQLIEPADQVDK